MNDKRMFKLSFRESNHPLPGTEYPLRCPSTFVTAFLDWYGCARTSNKEGRRYSGFAQPENASGIVWLFTTALL